MKYLSCKTCKYRVEHEEFGVKQWFCAHPDYKKEYDTHRRPLPKGNYAPSFCPRRKK